MRRLGVVAGAAAVGALALSAAGLPGLGGVAGADPGADGAMVMENLPTAGEVLVAGLQDAGLVLTTTGSAAQTAAAVGDALVATGEALVADTEQFGPVATGLLVVNDGFQELLAPFLGALDDPSGAARALDPAQLSTLAANLPAAADGLLHGDALADGLLAALAEGAQGNIIAGPGVGAVGTPAFIGNAFNGVGFGLTTLLAGTTLEPLVLPVAVVVLMATMVAADHIVEVESALAPAFEALGPVTEPLVAALEGL